MAGAQGLSSSGRLEVLPPDDSSFEFTDAYRQSLRRSSSANTPTSQTGSGDEKENVAEKKPDGPTSGARSKSAGSGVRPRRAPEKHQRPTTRPEKAASKVSVGAKAPTKGEKVSLGTKSVAEKTIVRGKTVGSKVANSSGEESIANQDQARENVADAAEATVSPGAAPGTVDETFITAVPSELLQNGQAGGLAYNAPLLKDEEELLRAIEESDKNEELTIWDLTGDADGQPGAVVMESIATKLEDIKKEQERRRQELGVYINNLIGKDDDDDGESFVVFPDDYQEVVESMERDDLRKKSQVFSADLEDKESQADKKIIKGLAKIRHLDHILHTKIRESKEVAKRVQNRKDDAKEAAAAEEKEKSKNGNKKKPGALLDDDEILQPGDRPSRAAVNRSLRKDDGSDKDFIRRNMDMGPNARFYTLAPEEEARVEELLKEPDAREVLGDTLPEGYGAYVGYRPPEDELERMSEIEKRLQSLVPPNDWDEKSVIGSTLPSTVLDQSAANVDRRPDYLRQIRESNDEREKLKEINDALHAMYDPEKRQTEEEKKATYDDIQRLIEQYNEEIAQFAGEGEGDSKRSSPVGSTNRSSVGSSSSAPSRGQSSQSSRSKTKRPQSRATSASTSRRSSTSDAGGEK